MNIGPIAKIKKLQRSKISCTAVETNLEAEAKLAATQAEQQNHGGSNNFLKMPEGKKNFKQLKKSKM